MEGDVNKICEGSGCNAPAIKHVVFGLRVFEAPDNIHISEVPYTIEHLNLCGDHAERVQHHYVHVTEYELGDCPAHPVDRSMSQNSVS